MTKPSGKPCRRCGERPMSGRGGLCEKCHGTCAECGGPAPKQKGGWYRTVCEPCRPKSTICSRCKGPRDGSHSNYCRACYREYSREWDARNPEKVAEKLRRHALKRSYGITVDVYDQMSAAQAGVCAICAGKPRGRGRLHVDHDHANGAVRGLLCSSCNPGVGYFRDDPALLRAAADYLERCRD